MNDLTKEALQRQLAGIERTQQINSPWGSLGLSSAHYGNALAQARPNIDPSFGRPKYGNDYLEPDRPLTGRARNYLTKWDERSRCDHIKDHPSFSFKYMMLGIEESRTGINLDKINRVSDEYRKISDEVDNEIGE